MSREAVERILRLPAVLDRVGESRSTVYSRIGSGHFPPPISLGARNVGFRESEVSALIAARIRGASDEDIRALVAELVTARKAA